MLFGTNLQYANSYNNRIVFEIIRLQGPVSRMDISKQTHLTVQTVTNITNKPAKSGLILEHLNELIYDPGRYRFQSI